MFTSDILGQRARLTPEKLALVFVPGGDSPKQRFTYAELNERAVHCAQFLLGRGLVPGDRVAILAHNCVEYLDAFFAAAKTGIILVPLNTRQTPHELEYVLCDAACRALLYEAGFAATANELRASCNFIEHWIGLAEVSAPAAVALTSWTANASVGGKIGPEDLLALLYTSGTTGKPKGVMIPHRMMLANAINTLTSWQLRDDDVSPIFTPLYHAGGLAVSLTAMFLVGATVVLHAAFDAGEVLRTLAEEKCTVAFGVPTIFKMLMDAPEFAGTDLRQLRWCISGGAPLPLYIAEAWQGRGVIFKQGYGLTEVGVNCFSMTAEESLRKAGSIGKPIMFSEARLATSGRDVPPGEIGELWLRGPHVCKGYWNNPEATAAALDADGWFHTGDLARQDADGYFYIAGRLKDMIISGGVNVYPAEIEAELLLHPGVRDVAVIGVPHETWGEVGVAFVVAVDNGALGAEELSAFLAERLGKYKLPKQFIFVAALPRTPYGKVLKPELRAWYAKRSPAQSGAAG